jgi:hypothetical protein
MSVANCRERYIVNVMSFSFIFFFVIQALSQLPADVQTELCKHCCLPESPVLMLEQLLMNEKVCCLSPVSEYSDLASVPDYWKKETRFIKSDGILRHGAEISVHPVKDTLICDCRIQCPLRRNFLP